jgi:hypothetical protein
MRARRSLRAARSHADAAGNGCAISTKKHGRRSLPRWIMCCATPEGQLGENGVAAITAKRILEFSCSHARTGDRRLRQWLSAKVDSDFDSGRDIKI